MNFSQFLENQQASYTAVVLHEPDRAKLRMQFPVEQNYEFIGHHMTINMGPATKGPAEHMLGTQIALRVITTASDDKVMAVGVETDVPSVNQMKHITIAVNRNKGGKPFHSNKLTNWSPVEPIMVNGVVAEVDQQGNILPVTD